MATTHEVGTSTEAKGAGARYKGLRNKTNNGGGGDARQSPNRTKPIKDKNGPNTSDTCPHARGDGRRKRKRNDNNTTSTTTYELRGKRYDTKFLTIPPTQHRIPVTWFRPGGHREPS